jgi:signal transduction histidine kinase
VRPLDPLRSIKVKLGVVIVATVVGTVLVLALGRRAGLSLEARVAVATVLGLAMVQLLARGMTSPLREMAAAATAMARGEYGRRVRATSRDEVGELARAFNAMAAELADADRMRRELVANVSHELRTPLGALHALLENLADGVEPPDPAALRTALAQTERLGRLVGQLLDLSRLESGGLELRPVAFGVRELLEQAANEARLAERPVRLRVTVQPGDLRATGDPERLHQVVANLLDNAVRHSPAEGRVWLCAHAATAGQTTIEVADEGPGIPAEEADRVFERFHRTDTARAARDGGTGLGLAIARWIVDAHGGAIRAEARDPRGCRMVVELPAGEPRP